MPILEVVKFIDWMMSVSYTLGETCPFRPFIATCLLQLKQNKCLNELIQMLIIGFWFWIWGNWYSPAMTSNERVAMHGRNGQVLS